MHDLEKKLLEDVDAILGPDGLLQQQAEHLAYSKNQHQYAQRAARGFARFDAASGRAAINMLQGATGTGKTLGYLVPLMLFAAYGKGKGNISRVAVSTFTRHLQKQILSEDAVMAARLVAARTGVNLSVALRLGISNYVSAVGAARLHDALARQEDARFDAALDFLDDLIDWAGQRDKNGAPVKSGLMFDFISEQGVSALPVGVDLRAISLGHDDDEEDKAAYLSMVDASKDADVLVVNHALLVNNAMRWSALLDDPDKRPITALVCDEADRLPDAAEGATGSGLALHRFVQSCQAAGDEKSLAAAVRLQEFVNAMKIPAAEAMPIADRSELAAHLQAVRDIMKPDAIQLADDLSAGRIMDAHDQADAATFLDAFRDVGAVLDAMRNSEASALISWSPVREYPSLRIGHPNPGRVLSRLWSQRRDADDPTAPPLRSCLDAVLMTSATLEMPGRELPRAFDDFASSVGILRHLSKDSGVAVHNVTTDLFARYEPSKFGQMRFVLAAPDAPSPSIRYDDESWETSPEWLDYATALIRAAHAAGGRTLVLAQSWADTAEIGRRLSGMDNLLVHVHGQSLPDAIAAYVATDNAVLITPSAWEGVNLPGLIQQLVVTRVPFPPLNGSMEAHRRIHFEHLGFSSDKIDAILHNDRETATRRKLMQGIGRGIRHKDDACTVWIADPRFPLPEAFADSLDPVLLEAPARRQRKVLRFCIPERFRTTTYQHARLFLTNGQLHSPSDL